MRGKHSKLKKAVAKIVKMSGKEFGYFKITTHNNILTISILNISILTISI